MSADLTTELQARQLISADVFVVRESRPQLVYVLWLVFRVGAFAGLTYPFWRSWLSPHADMPIGITFFAGLMMLMFSGVMGNDLKAARKPSSWVLIISINQLYINFRSFHHWHWPVEHKTVLRLSPHDIDSVQPIEYTIESRGRDKSIKYMRLLEVFLRDPLTPEQITVIKRENVQMPFKARGRARTRAMHKPLRVSEDGLVLAIDIGQTEPDFAGIVDALGSRYRVRPKAGLTAMTRMDDTAPDLTLAVVREIEALAASGNKFEAIRLLRQYTNLSLSEARQAVEKGITATVSHLIRRAV